MDASFFICNFPLYLLFYSTDELFFFSTLPFLFPLYCQSTHHFHVLLLSFSILTCLAHLSVTVNWIPFFPSLCSHFTYRIQFPCIILSALPLPLSCKPHIATLFLIQVPSPIIQDSHLLLPRSWAAWSWRCCLKISQNSSQPRCRWCGPN